MVIKKRKAAKNPPLLKAYAGKRNFKQSPEPVAALTKRKAPEAKGEQRARFVIHKHAASRLHYDLRLECEGVLRSWAIPRGPSMDPLENRLSVRVEDHPMRYQEFEGVIPQGNYGAGTIMVWDRGEYALYEALPRETHDQTFLRQYRKGSLKLEFFGQKLRGRFTLVKIKKSSGDDWLLIKKRDEFASTDDILAQEHSVHSGLSLSAIANSIEKPRAAKASASTKKVMAIAEPMLRKVSKQRIPEKILPMRPKKVAIDQGKISEDDAFVHAVPAGMLATAIVSASGVEVRTSTGLKLTPRCKAVCEELASFPDGSVFVGVAVLDKADSSFHVSDVLWFAKHKIAVRPLSERWSLLSALPWKAPLQLIASGDRKGKGSGMIWLRDRQAPYVFGESQNSWLVLAGQSVNQRPHPTRALLTNPDKVFWPEERLTKKDLYNYYEAVAHVMLPYLHDRPQSLNRHPNGIKGKSFFQKEVAGTVPGWIATTNVPSYGGTKTVTYLLCQNTETLLYMANMGCIEINAWLSRVPNITTPDYAVIDIDPGTLDFSKVVNGAKVIHKLLEKIGAKSFCKTSGGRGLHIYLPTDGKVAFADCQKFAELVGAYLHQALPSITSTNRSPLVRRSKLYVDALQNRKGQTMACVYSVRPRPGAPVSTPIAWKELTASLDPLSFTLKTVPKRIAKLGDLWEGMAKQKNDILALSSAVERLIAEKTL